MTMTPKQRAFVDEYLKDLNATQAAIRAGYSSRNASRIASELLDKTHVAHAINDALAARSERTRIDADWVLKRLAAEAEADMADLYNEETGALKPIHEWPEIWRQGLVAGVEVEELFDGAGSDRVHIGRVRKVRLDSRIKRLELIGKHIGVQAFKDVVEHQGLDGLAERLERAHKRAGEGE